MQNGTGMHQPPPSHLPRWVQSTRPDGFARPFASAALNRAALTLPLLCIAVGLWTVRAISHEMPDSPVPRGWSLVSATNEQIVLEVAVPEPIWVPGPGSQGCFQVRGFAASDLDRGRPLPIIDLPVAVPPEGEVSVDVQIVGVHPLGREFTEIQFEGPRVWPDQPPGGPTGEHLREALGWRFADRAGFVQFRKPGWAAGLRLLPIRVFAVRNSAAGHLVAPSLIRIRVNLGDWAIRAGSGPGAAGAERRLQTGRGKAGGPFTRLRAAVVVNPSQSRDWWRPAERGWPSSQVDGFTTATDGWLRIEIARRGVYVLTADDLEAVGVEPASVNPEELRLFCGDAGEIPESLAVDQLPQWMEPCALWVEHGGDGVWADTTRVYFLGNGPDGWRENLGLPESDEDPYYVHSYSNHFTYWLCWGGPFTTERVWMEARDASPGTLPLLETARARIHVEENRIYDTKPRERSLPWERFFWEGISASAAGIPAAVRLDLKRVVAGSEASFRVSLWGKNWISGDDHTDHHAVITVNGDTLSAAWWDGFTRMLATMEDEVFSASNTVMIHVPARPIGGSAIVSDHIYLAWVEAEYERRLSAGEDSLAFFVTAQDAAENGFRIRDFSDPQGWLLLDTSDLRSPVRMLPRIVETAEGYAAEFCVEPHGARADLVFLKSSSAATPAVIERRIWDELTFRQRSDAVDYLIVTGSEFVEAAEALADHRREHFWGGSGDSAQTARVAAVTIDGVLDEFAWGQHDPTALRNFIAYVRDRWAGGHLEATLSHLLLIGDAYYDPRDYLGNAVQDIVPSHTFFKWANQASTIWIPCFIADDWFGLLDGPEDEVLDLCLARMPVGSAEEASAVVTKIIDYDTEAPLGPWRTRMIFAADDVCQRYEPDEFNFAHMTQCEALSQEWAPTDALGQKVYLYEYGSECIYDRKPEATSDLMDALDAGALMFDFVGHGSEIQLADERLLEVANLASLKNGGKLFLMVTASCAVGKFAHGGDGLSLAALRLPEKGALAVISASTAAGSHGNFNLNKYLFEKLFPDSSVLGPVAIGPALLAAKWRAGQYNDLRYNLMGDPASRFASPGHRIEIHLEDVPGVSVGADTLMRGAVACLMGRIVDLEGQPVAGFSGKVNVLVLDSDIQRMPVLDRPETYYCLPGARIFSIDAEVSGGEFSTSFFVPTALRSGPRGPARIYTYAQEEGAGARDAAGALSNLFIPETGESVTDKTGPQIQLEWEEPDEPVQVGSRLMATLEDSSGIYVASLAPSRSVVVTVRDEAGRILLAEDIADLVTFGSTYMEASLTYAIPAGLPAGQPLRLVLEASDNVQQRGSAELSFELAGATEAGRLLARVFSMPNPMEMETHFLFEIEKEADLEVSIFTSSGLVIRRLPAEALTPERARSRGLYWDGRDDDGDRVANGLYFYRVVARDSHGRADDQVERLVVLR